MYNELINKPQVHRTIQTHSESPEQREREIHSSSQCLSQDITRHGHQSSKEKPVRESWARTAARNEDTGPCLSPVHSLAGLTGGAEGHEQQCVTEATEGERGPSSRAEVGLYGGNLKGKEAGPELGQMRQNPWYAL